MSAPLADGVVGARAAGYLPAMEIDPLSVARESHARLLESLRVARRAEHSVAKLLATVVDQRMHRTLGYATVSEYAEHGLGLESGKAYDLLRIGRSLPDLRAVDAALEAGELEWTKAREIVRVATPETAEAWVARAAHVSSRQLEQDVRHSLTGELPPKDDDPPREPARKRFSTMMETSGSPVTTKWASKAGSPIGSGSRCRASGARRSEIPIDRSAPATSTQQPSS